MGQLKLGVQIKSNVACRQAAPDCPLGLMNVQHLDRKDNSGFKLRRGGLSERNWLLNPWLLMQRILSVVQVEHALQRFASACRESD